MNAQKLKRMTQGGMLLSLTAILTAFIRVPLPVGYAHLGDGAVILSGVLLGPFGAACAAAGTVLADILSGYPIYIPFSIVVKALMALAAGRWLGGRGGVRRRKLFILAGIMLLVPAGYFPADVLFYGMQPALFSLAGNFGQAAVGFAVSALLLNASVFRRK